MDGNISPMQYFWFMDGKTEHVAMAARVPHPPTNVPEDDTVEYRETSSAAPEPPCHCDILELALGKGHEPTCPHYKEHPMP